MDGTSTGWEWALITNIMDKPRTDGQIAFPANWTAFDESEEARAGLVRGFPPAESWSEWARKSHFIIELPDPTPGRRQRYHSFICYRPERTEHSLLAFRLRPFLDFRTAQIKRERLGIGPHAKILVRAIPIPRLLGAFMSETPSTIEIIFRSLAGDQVGEATRSKDEGDFLMESLVELADQIAEQENLRISANQGLCVLVDGCHRQLLRTVVLWSPGADQESKSTASPHI